MTLLPVPTQRELYDNMSTYAEDFVLRNTGQALVRTDTDFLAIALEAAAASIRERLLLADTTARAVLPGPDSANLDDWGSLFGLTQEDGETNAAFWTRIQLASQQASLGSAVALTALVEGQDGILDVSFIQQADGDFDTYIISDADPPSGSKQGVPTTDLVSAISNLLNDGSRAHLGKDFDVSAGDPNDFSLYCIVRYFGQERPDTDEFQAEVAAECQRFVRAARRLGESVAISNLRLTRSDIEGINFVDARIFNGSPTSGNGDKDLTHTTTPTASMFWACDDTVNVVTQQSDAVRGEISIMYIIQ